MATDSRPPLGDLDENDLAAATMSIVDRVRPHLAAIVTVVAILFLGLAATVFVRSQASSEQALAWDALYRALPLRDSDQLRAIAADFRGEPAGTRALLALGDMALADGNGLLIRDPGRARGRLEDAVEFYSDANASRPTGIAAQRGILGLARARESLGSLAEARRGYETLVAEHPDSPFVPLAENRIAALDRPATERWYNWLASRSDANAGGEAEDSSDASPAASVEPAESAPDAEQSAEPPAG